MCVCAYVGVHACIYQGLKPMLSVFLIHHPPYLWGMVSHWAWSLLVWLPSDLQGPICFYSASLRVWLQVSAAFFSHSLFSKGRFELGILRVAFWGMLISFIFAHWQDDAESGSSPRVSGYWLPNALLCIFQAESHFILFHPIFYNLLILFMCSLPAHAGLCFV